MIIWRGRGVVVLLVAAALLVLTEAVMNGIQPGLYNQAEGGPIIAFTLSALAVWGLESTRVFKDEPRELIDAKTGKSVHLRRGDSLFFVPVKYWKLVFGALAAVFLVVSVATALLSTG